MKALADAAAPSLKKARKGRAQLADPQHAPDGSSDTAKGAPLSVALPEQSAGAPERMDIIGSPWYGRTDAGRAGASCGHARGVGLCLRRGSWSPATTRAGRGFRMPAECRRCPSATLCRPARAAGPRCHECSRYWSAAASLACTCASRASLPCPVCAENRMRSSRPMFSPASRMAACRSCWLRPSLSALV
mgnify:CR=1 FL=1